MFTTFVGIRRAVHAVYRRSGVFGSGVPATSPSADLSDFVRWRELSNSLIYNPPIGTLEMIPAISDCSQRERAVRHPAARFAEFFQTEKYRSGPR
jgi:hypothetical protein